ncbi:MAG: hypothetical protein WBB00_14470 [Mycobacterium sp.]
MFAATGPCLTAGIALVSAGIIAVAPVEPPPIAVPAVDAAVQLAAIPSPLELYPQVFATAWQNTAALAEAYFADPFPLTRLTARNQIGALADAAEALAAGDVGAALAAVGEVIAQPFKTVAGAVEYVGTLLEQPGAAEALFQIMFSPVLGGIAAAGVAIGDVIDAAIALDLVGLVNAVINIPARIIDGALNGGYGSPFGNFDNLPGLLTPLTVEGYLFPGPVALAINIDQDAADYIDEQADEAPAAPPAAVEANTVATLSDSTEPVDDADGTVEDEAPAEPEPVTNKRVAAESEATADDVPGDEDPVDVALTEDQDEPVDEDDHTGHEDTDPDGAGDTDDTSGTDGTDGAE